MWGVVNDFVIITALS